MSAPDPRLMDLTFLRLAAMRVKARREGSVLPLPPLPETGLASLLEWYRRQTSAEVEAPAVDAMSGLERLLAEAREQLRQQREG